MPQRGEKARTREEHVRVFVRDNVRAGLLTPDELRAEVGQAVRDELPWLPTAETAETWLREETAAWEAEAARWPEVTDHDRLQAAFTDLRSSGVAVLQGCEDHWAARSALEGPDARLGVAWFLPQDVWHAIDEGMLEVNVWHHDGANVAPGDDLLDLVVEILAEHGLEAHFDEGRVEVAAHWHRRP